MWLVMYKENQRKYLCLSVHVEKGHQNIDEILLKNI